MVSIGNAKASARVLSTEKLVIEKGHNPMDYFWIMPKKVKDIRQNTCDMDNLDEMEEAENEKVRCIYIAFTEAMDDIVRQGENKGYQRISVCGP